MASKGTTNAMMVTNKEFFKQACRWKDSSSTQTAKLLRSWAFLRLPSI